MFRAMAPNKITGPSVCGRGYPQIIPATAQNRIPS